MTEHAMLHHATDWQADLERFRAVCTPQRRVIDGHAWAYIQRGSGASLAYMDDYITVIERFLADERD